jgi:Tfp pilus assembly protein PilO
LNQRIAALTQCASRAGLAVDGIEPQTKRPGALYHVVPIRIAGKGRYAQVRAFISSLHREMPDTPVTSMDLSAVPSTAQSNVTFGIELQWHTAVAPAAGSVPAPAPADGSQLTNGI